MEFQQLRALVFVAETGSITEAARRLAVTQPAVTRQIHALEEEFGGTLLDRTTKPVRLTPFGSVALEQARRIIQLSEELRSQAASSARTPNGEVRLGVVHSLARLVIPSFVHELKRQYPDIRLRLTCSGSGSLRRDVADGLLDAAVVLVPHNSHLTVGAEGVRFSVESAVLVSSTKTPLRGVLPVEAMKDTEWVLSREGCGCRALLKQVLDEAGITLRISAEVLEADIQLQLIASGVGAGIYGASLLPPDLERHGLQTFTIRGMALLLDVWIIRRKGAKLVPLVMPTIENALSGVVMRNLSDTNRQDKKARGSMKELVQAL
jgi:DNA-binding transcriptional LysR family regulator